MRIVNAADLARDLGYSGATPAFWRFIKREGIEALHDKPFAFDLDKIAPSLESLRVAGRM